MVLTPHPPPDKSSTAFEPCSDERQTCNNVSYAESGAPQAYNTGIRADASCIQKLLGEYLFLFLKELINPLSRTRKCGTLRQSYNAHRLMSCIHVGCLQQRCMTRVNFSSGDLSQVDWSRSP